jgi:hypothetical protein
MHANTLLYSRSIIHGVHLIKNIIWVLLVFFVLGCSEEDTKQDVQEIEETASTVTSASDQLLLNAFQSEQSDLQIEGQGIVIKLLPDDTTGDKHQKFILKLTTDQTLLVSHNIDLAPRIDLLGLGDSVEFYGEYEWNDQGGVIHWTHKDPVGKHPDGWLRYNDILYQ